MTEGPIPDVDTNFKEQAILNRVYNAIKKSLTVDLPPLAVKITESGTTTYIAKAVVGTLQSSALWQVMKIDESSGTVITWADGDAFFDNVATDLTILNYA